MKKFLIILSICSLLILDIFIIWLAINDHYRDAPGEAVTATDEQPATVDPDDSVDTDVLDVAGSVEDAPGVAVATTDEQSAPVDPDDSVDTSVLDVAGSVEDAPGVAVATTDEQFAPVVAPYESIDTRILATADFVEDAPGEAVTVTDEKLDPSIAPDDTADTTVLTSADSFADALSEVVTAATKNTATAADVASDSDIGTNALANVDSYVDGLSSEVIGTSMESNGAITTTDENPEPAIVPDDSVDTSAIANQVINQLEKVLTGVSSGEVKQEDLAGIVSAAVKEGNEIDTIERAVNDAMAELRKKEGLDIQPETLEFAAKSINEIVGASRDIAQGDPSDPYIQSLNAEVDETSLKRSEGRDKQSTSRTPGVKATQAGIESIAETGRTKPDRTDTAKAQADRIRTIVVLKGETLHAIAAKIYGSGRKYPLLYKANRDILNNPDLIEIGQVLRVPPLPSE